MYDLYHIMKFVHIAAAIAWIGGGIVLLMLVQRVRADGNAAEMSALLGRIEALGKGFFAPMSVAVLVAGIVMAAIGGLFAAPWVSAGFLGIFVSAGIKMGYLTPTSGKLRALIDQHGMNHPGVGRLGAQIMLVSRIDTGILMLIVAAMVFKPGA